MKNAAETIIYLKINSDKKSGCGFESKYIATLPHYFQANQDEKWGVCLLSSSFKWKSIEIGNISLLIDEASSQIQYGDNRKILADIFSSGIEGTFEAENEKYLPLVCNPIQALTFSFIDNDGRRVELSDEYSLLKLKFCKIDQAMDYYLRVSGCAGEAKNELSINLPHHITLARDGAWKVALSSMYINIEDRETDYFVEVKHENAVHVILFSNEDLKNIQSILEIINLKVHNLKNWSAYDFDAYLTQNRVAIDCFQNISIRFSKNLGYKLGNVKYGYNSAGQWYNLKRSRLVFLGSIDMNRICENTPIIIKSSLVEPSIMNDKFESILKITQQKWSEDNVRNISYEAKNYEFVDVSFATLSEITLSFFDEVNNPIMLSPNLKSFVNLVFKKFI